MSLVRQNECKITVNYAAKCSQIEKEVDEGNAAEKSFLSSVFLLFIFDIM
jgi:hypothetical protein